NALRHLPVPHSIACLCAAVPCSELCLQRRRWTLRRVARPHAIRHPRAVVPDLEATTAASAIALAIRGDGPRCCVTIHSRVCASVAAAAADTVCLTSSST